jgi:hypothetical protein
VFVDIIPVSALLHIINFANCYQNGPKTLENNFLVSTLGKLLVFLVNYAYYATLFVMKKLGKVCIIGISIIYYGKNSHDLRPT